MQKLQYAAIGLGGRGMFDVQSISRHDKVRMVAGADVESATAKKLGDKVGCCSNSTWRTLTMRGHRRREERLFVRSRCHPNQFNLYEYSESHPSCNKNY